jgi:regulator of nonsense transcripts 2
VQAATAAARLQCEAKVAINEAREANASPARPPNEELSKLDSSIKKNATLTKKLRSVTSDTYESVLKDIRATNQSRFMTEAAAAVVEAVVRPSRVTPILKVQPTPTSI